MKIEGYFGSDYNSYKNLKTLHITNESNISNYFAYDYTSEFNNIEELYLHNIVDFNFSALYGFFNLKKYYICIE
jgi:hypothetical protein